MNTLFAPLTETQLKRTKSRCPVCHLTCPAEVVRIGNDPGRVELRRTCAVHGQFSVCLASDARFYWLAKGDPQNAACSGGEVLFRRRIGHRHAWPERPGPEG